MREFPAGHLPKLHGAVGGPDRPAVRDAVHRSSCPATAGGAALPDAKTAHAAAQAPDELLAALLHDVTNHGSDDVEGSSVHALPERAAAVPDDEH